jgi:hypothetical protein
MDRYMQRSAICHLVLNIINRSERRAPGSGHDLGKNGLKYVDNCTERCSLIAGFINTIVKETLSRRTRSRRNEEDQEDTGAL